MKIEDQKGFLLMDVVLAVLIITIALVSIVGMYTQSVRANSRANQYTIAANLAQQRLEEVKRDIEERRNSIRNWNEAEYPVNFTAVTSELPNGKVETTASLHSDPSAKIIILTVTVKWSDKAGSNDVAMSTYALRNTTFSTFPRN